MKSPWKFIGDLISRGRPAEPDEPAPADISEAGAEAEARPHLPHQSTELVSPPVEAELKPRADDSPAALETEFAPAERGPDSLAVTDTARMDGAAEKPAPVRQGRAHTGTGKASKRKETIKVVAPRTKRTGRAKPPPTAASVEKHEAGNNQTRRPAQVQGGFHADVENMEIEVQRLRRQLAQALIVQNAQLRKLLERFGEA